MPPFSALVLAGGSSRRMGTDKATLLVGGRPLISGAIDASVEAGASEVLVVGLPVGVDLDASVIRVADERPGEGPLGGIISGLHLAANPYVAVLACDLRHPAAATVRDLVQRLAAGSDDAVIPVVEGRRQTLFAAYRRSVCTDFEQYFDGGGRAIREAVRGLGVDEPSDLDPGSFVDLDTPSDVAPYR